MLWIALSLFATIMAFSYLRYFGGAVVLPSRLGNGGESVRRFCIFVQHGDVICVCANTTFSAEEIQQYGNRSYNGGFLWGDTSWKPSWEPSYKAGFLWQTEGTYTELLGFRWTNISRSVFFDNEKSLTVPMWIISIPFFGVVFWRSHRRNVMMRNGKCLGCGYQLQTNASCCSECGAVLSLKTPSAQR